jgi:hypothetical protein
MKTAALLLGIMVFGGCSTASAKQANVKFRQVASGAYASSMSGAPQIVVAHDADSYARMWDVLIGSGRPPQIDFSKETAVFLLDQQRPHGGYSIEPLSAATDSGTAIIEVASHAPKPGSMTAQVLTAPWSVIAVSKPGLASARWLDKTSRAVITETAKPH